MSQGVHVIFIFVIIFLKDWFTTKTCYYKLFWSNINYQSSLGKKFNIIIGWIWGFFFLIAYVKDEGSNLNVMTITLNFTVNYESFDLEENFQNTYLAMGFKKPTNMWSQMKKCAKFSNMNLLNLLNQICKNV